VGNYTGGIRGLYCGDPHCGDFTVGIPHCGGLCGIVQWASELNDHFYWGNRPNRASLWGIALRGLYCGQLSLQSILWDSVCVGESVG
jgi:hypothetical protein